MMYVRLHKGTTVDAVVPSAVGVAPSPAPNDIILAFTSDVNPSKTIQVTENVQATDPVTGALLYNSDGTPQWETTNTLDAQGNPIPVIDPTTGKPEVDANGNPVYEQTIVTKQVPKTVTLMSDPTQFSEADFSGLQYVVVGSLDDIKQQRISYVNEQFAMTMAAGFTSSADGTSRTYPGDVGTLDELLQLRSVLNANDFPSAGVDVLDIAGNHITMNQTEATTLLSDAQAFVLTNRSKRLTLTKTIQSAATEPDVMAVTW